MEIVYIVSTRGHTLVAQALNHVKWVEFSPSQCLSSVVSGGLIILLYSIEFSDYGATHYEIKPTLYPR